MENMLRKHLYSILMDNREFMVVFLVFALCAVERFCRLLSSPDIFGDEVMYVDVSLHLIMEGGLQFNGHSWFVHPPLFFMISGTVLRLLGINEVSLTAILVNRYISATFSMLTLFVIFIWIKSELGFVSSVTTIMITGLEPYTLKYFRIGILESMVNFFLVLFVFALRMAEKKAKPRYLPFAGLCLGLALVTKELSVYMFIVTILYLALTKLTLHRAIRTVEIATMFIVSLIPYSLYAVFGLISDSAGFIETKTYLLKRIVGLVTDTGYNSAGYPSIMSDLEETYNIYFMTITLLILSVLIVLYILARPHDDFSILLASWFIGSALFFGAIRIINPNFFVYIILPAMTMSCLLGSVMSFSRSRTMTVRVRYIVTIFLSIVILYNFAVSTSLFVRDSDDAFLQSVHWINESIPAGSRIMAVYQYSYFARGDTVISYGLDIATAAAEHVQYVITSPRWNYLFEQRLLDYTARNGTLIETFDGRSLRQISVFHVSGWGEDL